MHPYKQAVAAAGAWNNAAAGAGAGGFGNGAGAGAGGSAYEVDEYDVVDIEAPAATAKPTVQKASKIGGVFSSIGGGNVRSLPYQLIVHRPVMA